MHTKKDIEKPAARFEKCRKILVALGDVNGKRVYSNWTGVKSIKVR
ncbi:MAG: hypothetical protein VB031_09420 [Eubacteriaceae bacterium]|nr:hypothetical protein [Eubacteriaceae bacterium]